MAWLLSRGVAPRTVNHRLTVLRSFWRWMRREGVTITNPPADCERLPFRHKMPKYLSIGQSEKLLAGLAARQGLVARRDASALFLGDFHIYPLSKVGRRPRDLRCHSARGGGLGLPKDQRLALLWW